MTTMDFNNKLKRKEYLGRKYLPMYLQELNRLSLKNVGIKEILSLRETEEIKSKASYTRNFEKYSTEIPFQAKKLIREYFNNLANLKDGPIYILTEYSSFCGALLLPSLNIFNCNFLYTDEHAGIISIVLSDLTNEILLDFYERDNKYILEITTFGIPWSGVKIDYT